MNYQALTNDSLTVMYGAVREALAAYDALTRQGMETRFRVGPNGNSTPPISKPKCSNGE
jgi:hypothetical protein